MCEGSVTGRGGSPKGSTPRGRTPRGRMSPVRRPPATLQFPGYPGRLDYTPQDAPRPVQPGGGAGGRGAGAPESAGSPDPRAPRPSTILERELRRESLRRAWGPEAGLARPGGGLSFPAPSLSLQSWPRLRPRPRGAGTCGRRPPPATSSGSSWPAMVRAPPPTQGGVPGSGCG